VCVCVYCAFTVLNTVHTLYFNPKNQSPSPHNLDVRILLGLVRKTVLLGVRIVFSGLFPMRNVPHQQEVWKLAESFGAKCFTSLDNSITHLVARIPKTDKVNTATTMNGVNVVHETWLYECMVHFRRVKESRFPVQSGIQVFVTPFSRNPVRMESLIKDVSSPECDRSEKNVCGGW